MSRTLAPGRGSRLDATRQHNLSTILTTVHHHPGISRAELTRLSGLNRSTVGALVSELAELGLTREVAPEQHAARGRPSPHVYPRTEVVALAINPDFDALVIGLVGLGGTVHQRERYPWKGAPSVAETVEIATEVLERLRGETTPAPWVVGVGVAVPALVRSDDSSIVRAVHLDWTEEPLGEMLAAALHLPVVVRNDARVGTIAETVFGAGRGVSELIYLNGSPSGVGGGAIVDGVTLRGHDGFGGEMGHTAVVGGREQCHCGRRGCLETEVSLVRLLAALDRDAVDPRDLDDELSQAAANPRVRAEIQRQMTILAGAIGNFISIFNPELVILGGFLGSLYTAAPQMLDSAVARDSFAPIAESARIERAQLGSRLLLVGAAELAFSALLRDPAAHAQAMTA